MRPVSSPRPARAPSLSRAFGSARFTLNAGNTETTTMVNASSKPATTTSSPSRLHVHQNGMLSPSSARMKPLVARERSRREEDRECAAERAQNDVLERRLDDEPEARCAERDADADLVHARVRARQEQVADVDGGQEQDRQRQEVQDPEHDGAEYAPLFLLEAQDRDCVDGPLVGVRLREPDPLHQPSELGLGGFDRDAAAEAAHSAFSLLPE